MERRPLFPGYAFVSLDIARDAWRSVNGTFGVRRIIECGGQPAAVPEGIVAALMEMTNADGCVTFAAQFAVGDRVRFLAGPFTEMIGTLGQLDAQGRVRVLLSLFGRETEVQTRASNLAPAG